uniref:Tetratricopeptide repeat protein 30 n=1 Tax=Steinernema glaseri TaxID=37863 RepID=A0A1I7Y4H1_9BILA
MPPRSEDELDPVTLHNQALVHIDSNPNESFSKLQFLLTQNPFPPETFCNLLLLYCKYDYYELAADVLAENAHLTYKHLSQSMFDYLDALITQLTSPNDAYNKFDLISSEQIVQLRKAQKRIENTAENTVERHKAVDTYESVIEEYVPALMAQAKIVWDQGDYPKVERILQRGLEFIEHNPTWKLNVAHTIFMQEKFKEANAFYAPLVSGHLDDLLGLSAIVIANLCVAYIMASENEDAEDLMRRVEVEEENADPSKKTLHICIINLVIGTLYCSKGNFEFGITRIIKAMDPLDRKLSPDTWFYCKRCLMAMIENLAKHMSVIRDNVLMECISFLEQCEAYGKEVNTRMDGPLQDASAAGATSTNAKNTVTYEARLIRALLLQILGY